jgi:hypothetical protein
MKDLPIANEHVLACNVEQAMKIPAPHGFLSPRLVPHRQPRPIKII